ncbi:MAG: helix-turn-helix transcriptional regulator [Candidatus Pelethousia sp.]|nr:helix-turn-helix transcriptional regulator [Candidatus Pelethousia sp.]
MIQGDMLMYNKGKYDFKAIGQAIKEARESRGWTRERLAQEVNLAPRYIMSLENKGQHPSFQVFYELVTLFDISVDQFFFPNNEAEKDTQRRQLDSLLDTMDSKGLRIMTATAKGIREADAEEK